ncbi:2-oxoglutarate dehydrogenase E1 component, partial [Fictibacillus sp. Mic-4]
LGKHADQVERLILCSGKVAIDLATEIEAKEENFDWLHIARVEELYPFPEKEIQAIISRFANLKEIVWVQEEPKNMGSWMYIEPRIRAVAPENVSVDYIGRPDRSSTASGDAEVHKKEQAHIMHKALTAKIAVNQEGGHGRG